MSGGRQREQHGDQRVRQLAIVDRCHCYGNVYVGAGIAKAFLNRGYRVVANSRRITNSGAFSSAENLVTGVPTVPEVGLRVLIVGAEAVTVKLTPLLARPPTVTTTLPVVAPAGTVTAMLVLLQVVSVAAVPLKVTVLLPCVAPKFVPVIVTGVPTEIGRAHV